MSLERHSYSHSDNHPKSNEMRSSIVDLKNPRVQATLVLLQFPDDSRSEAMAKWLMPDETGISLADRYGGLRDEMGDQEVDLSDENAVKEILEKVHSHPPDTLH